MFIKNKQTILSKAVGISFLLTALAWAVTFLSAALAVPKEGNSLYVQQVAFGPFDLASITRQPVGMETIITIGLGKDILPFFALGIGLGVLAGALLHYKYSRSQQMNTP